MSKSQVRKAITRLYGDRASEFERKYIRNKKTVFLLILLLSIMAAGWYALKSKADPEPVDGKYLKRNEKGGNDKNLNIEAVSSEGYSEEMSILVKSRRYDEQELDELYETFCEELKKVIVPARETIDNVSTDMNLVSNIEGYPFDIIWHSLAPSVITDRGKIMKETSEVVELNAEISYEDYFREVLIPVCIKPHNKTAEEVFREMLGEKIEEMSMSSETKEYQELPTEVFGSTVRYSIVKEPTAVYLVIIGITVALLSGLAKDEELIKKAKGRDEQLKTDYSKFVNRIALYYGAGLPIRNIWEKMCAEYEQNRKNGLTGKRVVYEEMLKCNRKMIDGSTQRDAYDTFSERIGITEYTTIIGILKQAVSTGGTDISYVLKERRTAAFEEQKKRAKILGEQAGTKLLAPMFMMLLVVFIIVLFPAFMSF